MVSIGITGGVGSGKSEVLSYMEKEYGAVIILADKVAHLLEAKGQSCYNKLVKAFGEGILDSEGEIDKKRFASVIFADEKNLKIVNDIIHPAVKQYILEKMDESNKAGEKLFVLEAALLIEEGYDKIVGLLGEEILGADGEIDRNLMSLIVFEDDSKMKQVEQILHPAVKRRIVAMIDEARREKKVDYFFIEAALLIEDGYKLICDELWYIYASAATRTKRLMKSRGYTLQKIESIMDKQLSDAQFRKNCECVIDNDGDLEETRESIKKALN